MSISRLFWWIYQLSPADLVWSLLVCTIIFLFLHRQLCDRPWWCGVLAVLLALWAAAALWTTILNRSGMGECVLLLTHFHSYREFLDTGNREILRSSFMNVALFYPAGLLLAAVLPKRWRAIGVVTVLCLFSLSIEGLQYILALGMGEIDDVLHNTLCAVCGMLALSLDPYFSP